MQGEVSFDCGRHDAPTQPLSEDMDVWLFPSEWYNSIPNGFKLISISGENHLFEKGKTDDDRRFGCLAYGILRKPKSK